MTLRGFLVRRSVFASFVLGLVLGLPPAVLARQETAPVADKVSRFGEYSGYSEPEFDSYVRTSRYLEMRDGVKLAADILRPARGGQITDTPLPCVWTHTRYRRATTRPDGGVQCEGDSALSLPLIRHGYNIVVVDVRGSGASFGTWRGIFTQEETRDAYEITEWIAEQPWCDGKIGMMGGSYLGITQLMAAGTKPPHLEAIFPNVALFDLYDTAYHGGVYFDDFIRTWSELTRQLDTQIIAVGVDADEDGRLLEEAVQQHQDNRPLVEVLGRLPYRDSQDPVTQAYPYRQWHPAGYVEEINESAVPIYLWCGWFDSFTQDGFLMYRAFTAPRKIVIGAWSHSPRDPEIVQAAFIPLITEQLRWFDYWLKGIDNGILDEPPIRYHSMKGPKVNAWRTAETWPLPEAKPTRYFFRQGPSGSVESINDGRLAEEPPEASGGDEYTVDYTTTSGTSTRWDNAVGGGFGYGDLTSNDEKALTYTTPVLDQDLDVTGHPIARLWVDSTATDGDFFLFLEEVDASGQSHYVSEGTLRASHRKLLAPRIEALDFLPWHPSRKEDLLPWAPGEAIELVIALQPTSNVFDAGHRLRLTICCADADNARTPPRTPAPEVTLYRGGDHASYLELPVLGGDAADR